MTEQMATPAPVAEPDPRVIRIHAELAELDTLYRRQSRRAAWLTASLPILSLFVGIFIGLSLWLLFAAVVSVLFYCLRGA